MSDFSEFIKNMNNINNNEFKDSKRDSKAEQEIPNNAKLEDMINKYSKYSNEDLMSEFLKLTAEKKCNGELSNNEIEKMKSTILPLLNEEQKNNLEKILNVVKNV